MMFNEGHDKLTIGSCCLSEFKSEYTKKDFDRLFPDLRDDPMHYDFAGITMCGNMYTVHIPVVGVMSILDTHIEPSHLVKSMM